MPTVFERIWDREILATELYRNDDLGVMAILDNNPAVRGQAVVFPREPAPNLEDLSFEREAAVWRVARAVGRPMLNVLGAERVVRHVEGYGVPEHAHVIVLPSFMRGDSDRLHHPGDKLHLGGPNLEEYLRVYQARLWLSPEVLVAEGLPPHQPDLVLMGNDFEQRSAL